MQFKTQTSQDLEWEVKEFLRVTQTSGDAVTETGSVKQIVGWRRAYTLYLTLSLKGFRDTSMELPSRRQSCISGSGNFQGADFIWCLLPCSMQLRLRTWVKFPKDRAQTGKEEGLSLNPEELQHFMDRLRGERSNKMAKNAH